MHTPPHLCLSRCSRWNPARTPFCHSCTDRIAPAESARTPPAVIREPTFALARFPTDIHRASCVLILQLGHRGFHGPTEWLAASLTMGREENFPFAMVSYVSEMPLRSTTETMVSSDGKNSLGHGTRIPRQLEDRGSTLLQRVRQDIGRIAVARGEPRFEVAGSRVRREMGPCMRERPRTL